MKKIKFKAILSDIHIDTSPKVSLEYLGLHLTTELTKKEMEDVHTLFLKKEIIQITIKKDASSKPKK